MSKSLKNLQAELRKLRETEQTEQHNAEQEAAQKKKNEARQLDLQQSIDEAEKARWSGETDRAGNPLDHYAVAAQKADRIINQEVTSINDWRACMSSLLSLCMSINRALGGSSKKMLATYVNPALKQFAWAAYDKVTGAPTLNLDSPLPSLQHHVHYTDEHTLKIEPLVRADEKNVVRNMNDFFKEGIVEWLNELGYDPDPAVENGFFNRLTAAKLTQDEFNRLKADPDRGLEHFLSEGSDLSFVEEPSMGMRR